MNKERGEDTDVDIDRSRRSIALSLLGAVGGAAVLKGCAAGARPTTESESSEEEDLGSLELAATGTSFRWFDKMNGTVSDPGLDNTNGSAANDVAVLLGYYAPGDGGGGVFFWDPASTATADGGTIVGTATTGRWKRLHDGDLSVKWFGARGTDTLPHTPSYAGDFGPFFNACEALRARGGGGLYIPKGIYYLEHAYPYVIRPGSNVTIHGEGEGTIVSRQAASGAIEISGERGVRVTGIHFHYPEAIAFMRGISAVNAEDVFIDHCTFHCSAPDSAFPPPLGSGTDTYTLMALVFLGAKNFRVHDCKFFRMQAKGGVIGNDDPPSDRVTRKISFYHNTFIESHDFCISVVSFANAGLISGTRISEVYIVGNIIDTPRSTGVFFIGADGETRAVEHLREVLVKDNICTGPSSATSHTLCNFNIGVHTSDIVIDHNTFVSDTVGSNDGSQIVRIVSTNAPNLPANTFTNLQVTNNTLRGADLQAILIQGNGENLRVSGNRVSNNRGIWILAAGPTGNGIRNLEVADNTVATSAGITLDASLGYVQNASVSRNTCYNNGGAFEAGAGIQLVSAGGNLLSAAVENNRCYDTTAGGAFAQSYGVRQSGSSSNFNVAYHANDCRGNVIAGASIASGSAIGADNRGGGFPSTAPASGTWSAGDRVQNHSPAVGQPKGWICTVGGTPGTWVSEGNL